jgi:hypothetical protein
MQHLLYLLSDLNMECSWMMCVTLGSASIDTHANVSLLWKQELGRVKQA